MAALNVDSEDEGVKQRVIKVGLKCPITSQRITLPAQGHDCKHIQCFDLESYLKINCEHNQWRCPVCTKLVILECLETDWYIWSILEKLTSTDTDKVIVDQKANWKAVQLRQGSSDVIYVSDDNQGNGECGNQKQQQQDVPNTSQGASGISNGEGPNYNLSTAQDRIDVPNNINQMYENQHNNTNNSSDVIHISDDDQDKEDCGNQKQQQQYGPINTSQEASGISNGEGPNYNLSTEQDRIDVPNNINQMYENQHNNTNNSDPGSNIQDTVPASMHSVVSSTTNNGLMSNNPPAALDGSLLHPPAIFVTPHDRSPASPQVTVQCPHSATLGSQQPTSQPSPVSAALSTVTNSLPMLSPDYVTDFFQDSQMN